MTKYFLRPELETEDGGPEKSSGRTVDIVGGAGDGFDNLPPKLPKDPGYMGAYSAGQARAAEGKLAGAATE